MIALLAKEDRVPKLKRLPRDSSAEAISGALNQDGAVIVLNVLGENELEALRGELAPYVAATGDGRDDFTGRKTSRTGALVARSQACRDLVMHATVLGGAKHFLKPYCETIQLHLTQLICIKDGQPKQPVHRDRLAWGGFLPADIEPQFNTIWAVTDFTFENGATQLVPGSNKWKSGRQPTDDEIEYAEMPAGSVLFYSGSVIHGGGANVSGADRMGLNITYTLGWLRQEENQYLSCPPHIARNFDPELQALLGYAMGSYALGYFTPPLAAGEGPECVPAEYALTGALPDDGQWGGDEMYAQVSARAVKGAR